MAPQQEHRWFTPLSFSLLVSVAGCIITSIWCLSSGYTIIFQNLFYIPIIIACLFYQRKGLILSCILAISYLVLVLLFTPDPLVLLQAGIRVLIFIGVALVISYLADILKKTERSLRNTARVQETIIRNAQVWLMGLDQDRRVRVWNAAAGEMSGYPAEEVLGRENIWDLLYPDPGYREEVISRIPLDGSEDRECSDYTTRVRTRSGEERIISWNAKVLADGDDDLLKYIIIGVDLTEKERISREYRRQSLFLQTLIETLPLPVFYKDLDGVYTGCNSSFETYFGRSRDDIIGRSVYDLWPPEMADRYHEADLEVFRSPAPQQYESRVRYPDGSERDVIFYKAPIRDESDQVSGLVGAFLDITARKRSEDALRESERRYRSLFDNMIEGFAYCRMIYGENGAPADWEYLDVNAAFEEQTGLTDVKGRRASEIFPGIRDSSPGLFEMYNRVILTGDPVSFETLFGHLWIWLRITVYSPEKDHFIAVFENITPRKKAEEELQKTIRDLEVILKNVPAMISYKDSASRYVKINPAVSRVMGKPAGDIEGKTYAELFPGRPDPFSATDHQVIGSGSPVIGSIQSLTGPDGNRMWVQTDTVPLTGTDGEVIGVLVVSTDITGTKIAKDALVQTNHKLNLLSGITRHDIGNELQVLFGSAEIAREYEMDTGLRKLIEAIDTAAHHIGRQIAFTRDYQDIGVMSPVWQNVHDIICQACGEIDISPVEVRIGIDDMEVFADPLIGKVFYNLIDNANRYGEKITQVRFQGSVTGGRYIICCEDDIAPL